MPLYEVRAEVVAYLWAENHPDASRQAGRAADEEMLNGWTEVSVSRVTPDTRPARGWTSGSCVYGEDLPSPNLTLGEAPELMRHAKD